MMRLPLACLLALLGGLLLWCSFAPASFGLAAVVGVALLILALHGATLRRGLLVGLLGGLAFFWPLLGWLHVVGLDAALALGAYCAAWMAAMGAATALVSRLPGWPLWAAAVWTLQEWLRGTIPFGGFPWGRLAFAQPDMPVAHLAVLGGLSAVSFAVALAGASLAAGILAIRAGRARTALAWCVLVIVVCLAPGVIPLVERGTASAIVAVVQGGTPQTGLGAMDVRRAVLENHVRETMTLARRVQAGAVAQPDFVVWPENSSDIDPFGDVEAAALISAAARAVNAPILVGAIVDVPGNPDGVWNLGVVWDPLRGPGHRYIKRHPVPFGEYIPLRSLIAPHIERFERIPRDFVAGEQAGLFPIGDVLIGDLICFEVVYDDVVQPLLDGRAQVLTVQTNNATYAGTAQPEQQLAVERMRAIESGRWVAVAATTGITAFIRQDGQVQAELDEGEVGSLVAAVPLVDGLTPAALIGPWFTLALGLAGAGSLIVAGWARLRYGGDPVR